MNFNNLTVQFYFVKEETWPGDPVNPVNKTLPFISISQSVTGSYGISLDGSPVFYTMPGECFIAPAYSKQHIIHINDEEKGYNRYRFIFFNILTSDGIDVTEYIKPPVICKGEDSLYIGNCISELISLNDCNDLESQAQIHRLIFEILCKVIKISDIDTKAIESSALMPAFKYIRHNLSEKIETETLAALCGYSTSHFYTLFRSKTGVTPGKYIVSKRLHESCKLLLSTENSIRTIAETLGFADQFHFSREFKKLFAISPSEYRQRIK